MTTAPLPEITVYTAADHDWLVEAHGRLYAAENGFDASFPIVVDAALQNFETSHDPSCERGWVLRDGARRLGSIFCVREETSTARLRLFLLEPEMRGRGQGRRLLETCMGFARGHGYRRTVLATHESHRAACALYARTGFACTRSTPVRSYGQDLVEQVWERPL
ncbi:GNAT family N-acetyltransferase [Salipiger bermudensis]|uniref:GNAT family N-acetyltransferase n=1 Tax=Salipiger bermudensis TaxID=344736 RepID=UPI001CD7103A|nr:GNAT family N-acetyltransferase [Salipiger bermudensis]MCA0961900.1 GNAT family N-acetyltransferase [Salipiger bermudensis]